MPTTLTVKGQVTIPKPIRDRLGLEPGSAVVFELDERGRAYLRAEAGEVRPASRFARLRGTAAKGMTTEEIMRLTRGEA